MWKAPPEKVCQGAFWSFSKPGVTTILNRSVVYPSLLTGVSNLLPNQPLERQASEIWGRRAFQSKLQMLPPRVTNSYWDMLSSLKIADRHAVSVFSMIFFVVYVFSVSWCHLKYFLFKFLLVFIISCGGGWAGGRKEGKGRNERQGDGETGINKDRAWETLIFIPHIPASVDECFKIKKLYLHSCLGTIQITWPE